MGSHRKSVIVGAVFAMLAAPALAADLPPVVEPPVTPPLEDFSAWYIRGDIGYKMYSDPEVNYANGAVELGEEEFDNTWMVGLGVGYQFNRYLRADVTVDYEFEADFDSRTACVGACGATLGSTTDESNMTVWTFMLNGYVDLAHWNGFTPYVGAGIGVAYIDIDELVETSGFGNPPIPGGEQWNFAANAMAGVAFNITEYLLVDANYRYLWLGDVEGDRDVGGNRLEYEDLAAHEIRVGLRYMIY